MCRSWEKIFRELLDRTSEKNCYYYPAGEHKISESEPAKYFIENYFVRGGKKDLLPSESDILPMRHEHMRAVFLIGIYFYDKITPLQEAINKCVKEMYKKVHHHECSNYRNEFLYVWYLTALYHDFGYCYERPNGVIPSDAHDMRIKIGGDLQEYGAQENILAIPDVLRENAAQYFHLRMNCPFFSKKLIMDHGVCAGIILYEKMHQKHSKTTIEGPDENDLYWGKPIFKNYIIPVVWSIICHNIWTCFTKDCDATKYRKFNLSSLIMEENSSLIHFDKHPLLFLLCLVDTIDPIKKNPNIAMEDILKSIFINTRENQMTLKSNSYNVPQKSLAFLESDRFKVSEENNVLTLSFEAQ